ncbi:hypothetical protein ABI_46470 [Asticcacaulis biprosthecium C19]|uniref:Sialate O-acetylesterase domain-containing protein n=1 Tax=Asticcacaulis biprosthecium C19 TaxID=715226 RepID=F4QTZ9_9CAUL|nr:sialate O-acetylesterase [Asticcacaulis biprosthecium]EGF89299.1 hypothetical protein ABI_46470 [Asticcacaulis biprosthecium C19]
MIDRRSALTAALALSLPGCAPTAKTPWHVFLLAGQSNMAGRGVIPQPMDADGLPSPDIFMWDPDAGIIPATDPIPHPERGVKPTAIGPGLSFAKAWRAAKGGRVLLVGAAWGGTGFFVKVPKYGQRWLKTADPTVGGDLFRGAVTRANAAIKAARATGPVTFGGILWHQGESDISIGAMAGYATAHVELMQALRTEITGAADAPIVVGELTPQYLAREGEALQKLDPEQLRLFLNYIHNIDKHLPHAGWVSSAGLTCKPGDPVHFDAAAQRTFGRRYAERLLTL